MTGGGVSEGCDCVVVVELPGVGFFAYARIHWRGHSANHNSPVLKGEILNRSKFDIRRQHSFTHSIDA